MDISTRIAQIRKEIADIDGAIEEYWYQVEQDDSVWEALYEDRLICEREELEDELDYLQSKVSTA